MDGRVLTWAMRARRYENVFLGTCVRRETIRVTGCVVRRGTAIQRTTGRCKVSGSAIRGSVASQLYRIGPTLTTRAHGVVSIGGSRHRVHKKVTAGRGCTRLRTM